MVWRAEVEKILYVQSVIATLESYPHPPSFASCEQL